MKKEKLKEVKKEKRRKERLKKERLKKEVKEKFTTLITAALGLVAALAWNEAIKSLFKGPCEVADAGALCALHLGGPWIYAVLVTVLAAIITLIITREEK